MLPSPVVLSLPIDDRRTSHAFYRQVLGVEAVGEPAEDGVPEPLQFPLGEDVRLMLVPRGGFGWVVGSHPVADPGHSECVLSLTADAEGVVDTIVQRATDAGGQVVTPPGPQPWGYVATFTDPDGHLWMVVKPA